MDNYVPVDITEEARATAAAFSKEKPASSPMEMEQDRRIPLKNTRLCGDRIKTKVLGKDAFMTDHETVDIRYVEQVADTEQTASFFFTCTEMCSTEKRALLTVWIF